MVPMHRLIYRGQSMRGTFRPGDMLFVMPVTLADVHLGDVVAYHSENETITAHRVVGRNGSCLITAGDANPRVDRRAIETGGLVGRVIYVERNGTLSQVCNGWSGMIQRQLTKLRLYGRQWMRARITRVAYPSYRRLLNFAVLRRLWRPKLTCIQVASVLGPSIKYLLRGRTVAVYYPDKHRFICRRPFDLFIKPPSDSC